MRHRFRQLALSLTVIVTIYGCSKKEVDISSIISHRTLGLAYLEDNRLIEAEKEFRTLSELTPNEAIGYADLGLVLMQMNRFEEAENQMLKAIEIDSLNVDIRLILAQLYDFSGRSDMAIKQLEHILTFSPDHFKVLYSLAWFYTRSESDQLLPLAEEYLTRVIDQKPGNLVARLELLELLSKNNKPNRALHHLQEIRRQFAELPDKAKPPYERIQTLLMESQAQEAIRPIVVLHNYLKETTLYQTDIREVRSPDGAIGGSPILNFSQQFYQAPGRHEAILAQVRFSDVSAFAGLASLQPISNLDATDTKDGTLAVGDFDADGQEDLFVGIPTADTNSRTHYLFKNVSGKFIDVTSESGLELDEVIEDALFADYDNDGRLDLFLATGHGSFLYHNEEGGLFIDVSEKAGLSSHDAAVSVAFVDFDHEGDLDIFLAKETSNVALRNNLDGTFKEMTQQMNVVGQDLATRKINFADFDEDGDIDIFLANANAGNVLYGNLRQGRFEDVTSQSNLGRESQAASSDIGDYNNDGFIDLFVLGRDQGQFSLYRNITAGRFEEDLDQTALVQGLDGLEGKCVRFFDFDNDGYLDLVIVGRVVDPSTDARSARIFHNDGSGRFVDMSEVLPSGTAAILEVELIDYDEDGDIDQIFLASDGQVHLLRNDGGNSNHYLKVQLAALGGEGGKNNHFGIGSKIEMRSGNLYQTRVVKSPLVHFGLGPQPKTDAVRIVWTNGVSQNMVSPESDQEIVAEQTLKGSCAFLYVWNGKETSFVTDILWRSALGMPLGIMSGGKTAYGFANSAREFLKIPSGILQEKNGKYLMQLTEELWETVYIDEFKLLVLDHPDSFEVYVDERFIPPPIPPLHIYTAENKKQPVSAMDEKGTDLLPFIKEKDDVYVANLIPTRFQGITELHDLILDLGDIDSATRIVLFMNGWVFPSDASINVSTAQSQLHKVIPPILQVSDKAGRWETIIENISFPAGKNKICVIDLSNKFPTDDFRIRIRTNMQVYWDQIFFTTGPENTQIETVTLEPVEANLDYRGFSRLYRKGQNGPHWFDYNDVSPDHKWRDLVGLYTRYGDVRSLLLEADDQFVILNAGDEISVEFDAAGLPTLKAGWTRNFLVYSDGWIKDGDLNTAHGRTVEPLPFQAMSQYPYGENEHYPRDKQHMEFLKNYLTRRVDGTDFQNPLKKRDN